MKKSTRAHTANPHRVRAPISACIAALISVALQPATALALCVGDMNCDSAANIADIPLFVDALLATGTFGGCDITRADVNADGLINGRDVQPFVSLLLAPLGPCFGGQMWCDGACREVELNPSHCGCCFNQCGPGENCAGGLCQPAEPPP